MAQSVKSCNISGGRIRAKCSRCHRVSYIEVSPGTRRKIVRCSCGKSSSYQINYRSSIRETAHSRAHAVLANATEAKILLCDSSSGGVGFTIAKEFANSLHRGQELRIKFRGGGSMAQRKIEVKNVSGNRIGAEYKALGTSL